MKQKIKEFHRNERQIPKNMKDNGNNTVILHINWKKYLYKCIKSFLTQINEQVQQCKYMKNHNFSNRYPNYMYLINKNSVI